MNTIFLASLASAALAAPVAVPADAHATNVGYTSAPVAVTACAVESQALPIAFGRGASTVVSVPSGNVRLSFVNSSSTKATSIEFALRSGDSVDNVIDNGSFATGATISHEFSRNLANADVTCNVEKVNYADGTSWQRH
jgi:hypothetical protein